jgi:hypothetical protein
MVAAFSDRLYIAILSQTRLGNVLDAVIGKKSV